MSIRCVVLLVVKPMSNYSRKPLRPFSINTLINENKGQGYECRSHCMICLLRFQWKIIKTQKRGKRYKRDSQSHRLGVGV